MINKPSLFLTIFLVAGGISACSKKDGGTSPSSMSAKTLYHCAMHPQIISDKPGDCPICHMHLIPIENASSVSPVAGQAMVHFSPDTEQRIGVAVSPVEMRDLDVPIRAAAKVAYDPLLYNAALEHQEAAAFLRRARDQNSPDLLEQAKATVESSELRLRQMGLSEEQIAEIEKPGYDASDFLLGNKNGAAWVYANVFDYEAALIHPGQDVLLTSPAMPGETFHGIVRALDPILNGETRTLRIRIQVADAGGRLRPETYISAVIQAKLGRRLAVPDSAVMDTGSRQLVYVQKNAGTYEPRNVQVGRRAGDYDEILSGVQEGENVVTAANFFIDSESRLQAATQKALETR